MALGCHHRRHQYYRTDFVFCHREAELLNVLEAKGLTKQFGAEVAVEDVSFRLEENTATALIGPNGAGKTTILSMLTGLLKQSEGTINQSGQGGIGFLPQYPQFFPWLTALEFVEMAAKISGVEAANVRQQSVRTLEFVGLGPAMKKKCGTFSGGMKQRLGLAQAIVHQPKLLLLDEPVSALDPTGRREILNLLKSLQQDTTILYSTHILNDAEEMTDQLLFLQQGKLVEQGSLKEVRDRYSEPRIQIRFETSQEALRFGALNAWQGTVDRTEVILPVTTQGPTMQMVLERLAAEGLAVSGVERKSATLEEIFLKVAGTK